MAGFMVALLVLLSTACSQESAAGSGKVVATTTILGALAAEVADDHVDVEVLLSPGTDPHDYQPSSQEIAMLHSADLVVANGYGLEESLLDALDAARRSGVTVLEVATHVDPLPSADGSGTDPHFWMDPLRLARAAEALAEALSELDASVDWVGAAAMVAREMEELDRQISEILSVIPIADRRLITNHDAFAYFADRYDFQIVGSVFPTSGEQADPSSAHLAELVRLVDVLGAPAIFAEVGETRDLAEAVAAEAGRPVEVIALYSDSLGEPGSGADTLAGMLLTNAHLIAQGLAN